MRKLYIFGLIGLAVVIIGLAFADQMTFTTYYPAPHGAYNNMVVMNSLGVGTTDPGTARVAVIGGNVGIGTTNPESRLHIRGGPLVLQTANVTDSFDIQFYNPNDVYGDYKWDLTYRGSNYNNDLYLYRGPVPSTTPVMAWEYSSGNVGIGTASPQSFQDSREIKLDVTENIVAKDIYLDDPKSGSARWASEVGAGFTTCVIKHVTGGASQAKTACCDSGWTLTGGGCCGDGVTRDFPSGNCWECRSGYDVVTDAYVVCCQ